MSDDSSFSTWSCCGYKVKRNKLKRYFVMANIFISGVGMFICFDCVGALQQALMNKFQISFSDYSLLYSVHTWASIGISFCGGFLIDRVFGVRFGTLFYTFVFVTGHLLFALGVSLASFWCSLLGRFINGVGQDFVYIGMQLYSVYYFKGKGLSMVICTNTSMGRLGTSLVYSISEPLLTYIRNVVPGTADVGIVIFIVGCFVLLTVSSAVILFMITPKTIHKSSKRNKYEHGYACRDNRKIKFKDGYNLPLEFWLLSFISVSFIVSIFVFLPFTQEMFKTVSGITVEQANQVTSFLNIAGAVTAPIIGIVIDKFGREIYAVQLGFTCAITAHLGLGFFSWNPYICMCILSLSNGILYGCLLPMVSFLIPEYKLGTAYGVVVSFCNAGFALCIYLAGMTIDKYSYIGLSVFLITILTGGFLVSTVLLIVDKRRNGILNIGSVERRVIMQRESAKLDDETAETLKSQTESKLCPIGE